MLFYIQTSMPSVYGRQPKPVRTSEAKKRSLAEFFCYLISLPLLILSFCTAAPPKRGTTTTTTTTTTQY